MNYAALRQELSDRGFSYLSATRLGQYINWARAELDEMDLWPYRESFAIGSSPLAISDLATVEKVVDLDTNVALAAAEWGALLEAYGDLSVTGTPQFYYVAEPSGTPEVATFPVGSNIGVQYWKVTPDLVSDGSAPAAPARFHRAIVNIAVRMAYRDADNHAAAEALQSEIERDVLSMRMAYVQTSDPVNGVRRTEAW